VGYTRPGGFAASILDMKLFLPVVAIVLGAASPAHADEQLRREALAMFGRIEAAPAAAMTREVELGRALYWDERISLDGKTSCGSCHFARDWGADRRRFSPDARGALTSRHSPTIFNSVDQPALRWLSDRKTAADQAEGSLTGSLGFASKAAALEKLRELEYAAAFRAAYPKEAEPMTLLNYGRAVEAYEATLTTPAAFDRFLGGDDAALSAAQKAGLRAFMATGCGACHSGKLLGGTSNQKFGVLKDYWLETGSSKVDAGRVSATKKEEDRYVFRVPMLRNVAKTAPYFHDGSVEQLDRAVRIMASVQLGKTLDEATTRSIVAFLESLTGEVPANYAPPGRKPDL
jgi:cytochrome c peroxidase